MENWKPTSRPITYAEWLERGTSIDRLVIHFWAEWNMYDRHVNRALQEVFDSIELDVDWRSFDIDHNPQAFGWLKSSGYGSVPRVVGFRQGKELGIEPGHMQANLYRTALRKWFVKA